MLLTVKVVCYASLMSTTTATLLHPSRYKSMSGQVRGRIVRPAVIRQATLAGYVATIETPTGSVLMARCYLCGSWADVRMFALDHVDPATKPLPGIYLEDLALACTPCNSRKRDSAADYPY